nr:xylulose kinase-1 [Tanacetum cinerariifolium]
MKMEHYLSHTYYPIWQVIQNDNGHVSVTIDTNGMIKVLPLKTGEEVMARERERKARTTLLMALPKDHLAKFHKMAYAKEMHEAIKSRFKVYIKGLDTLTFNDLYNNLRVFKRDVNGTPGSSSSNKQNVAFVSVDNTSSTNDVSIAYSVSSPSVSKPHKEGSSSYTDEVIHSFFVNQSSAPQLDCDDLEQINDDDLEEMDLKWDPDGFDKTKVECFNCHKIWHFARDYIAKRNQDSKRRDVEYNGNKARDNGRRTIYQDDSKSLVTMDGEVIDWSGHVDEDTHNYAMMTYSSSNLGSDNKVKSCSKTCAESYARLKKLYDEQRDKLGDASVEITAYTLALKVGLDLSKLAIILNRLRKIHSKGLTSGDDNNNGDHPQTSNTSLAAMKIEHYLSHTDYPIWKVIHNRNGHVSVTTYTNEIIKVLPPKTVEEVMARERERKARTTLLMALPEDHLAKFHKMAGTKEMWEAIKSRFGGNDESKRIQKYLLKQQFKGFSVSTSEGLHEGYDSAPQLDYDDLEQINDDDIEEMDLKWQVAMISMRIKKFYKRTGKKLQFDTKYPVGFDKTKVECFNCHKIGHFARDCIAKGNQDTRRRDAGYNGNKTIDNGRRPAY